MKRSTLRHSARTRCIHTSSAPTMSSKPASCRRHRRRASLFPDNSHCKVLHGESSASADVEVLHGESPTKPHRHHTQPPVCSARCRAVALLQTLEIGGLGFVWLHADSCLHCVASPFYSFVTTFCDGTVMPHSLRVPSLDL